jgi:hypothetical protein
VTNLTTISLPGPDERLTLKEWAIHRLQSVGHDPPIDRQGADQQGVDQHRLDQHGLDQQERNFRAAMLAHLAEKRFVPEPALFYAVRSGNAPFTSAVRRRVAASLSAEVETALGSEVDEFYRSFFQLPADDRQARWRELCERGRLSHRLTARLQHLADGLEVDPQSFADETPELRRLAEAILDIFLAPPPERAGRMRAFLQADRPDLARGRAAAWRLARRFPQVADLNSVLVRRVRSREHRWRLRRKVRVQGVDSVSQVNFNVPHPFLVFVGVVASAVIGLSYSLDQPGNTIRRSPPSPSATQQAIQILDRITRVQRPPSAPNFRSPLNPGRPAAGVTPPSTNPGRAPRAGLPSPSSVPLGGNLSSPASGPIGPSPERPGPRG